MTNTNQMHPVEEAARIYGSEASLARALRVMGIPAHRDQ